MAGGTRFRVLLRCRLDYVKFSCLSYSFYYACLSLHLYPDFFIDLNLTLDNFFLFNSNPGRGKKGNLLRSVINFSFNFSRAVHDV